ncbi:MAG: mechanosensitive ion channel [Leptospiraceae bacterium]|nr:mechanosensitive ion channel [Leptospiraceae bacterium]
MKEVLVKAKAFLDVEFFGNDLWQILTFLGAILGAFVLSALTRWIMNSVARKIAEKTDSEVDDIMVSVVARPAIATVFVIIVYPALDFLNLSEGVQSGAESVFTVVITLLITIALANLYEKLLDYWLTPIAEKSDTKLDDQVFPIIIRGGKYTIIVLGAIIALSNAGYNIYSLLAGLGVGGFALAMAARETLAHAFGGVTIFTDRPFRMGDYVIIDADKEYEGVVDAIGLRSTRIRTRFDTLLFLPNAIVTNQPLVNISAYGERRRHSTSLYLDRDNSPEFVDRALLLVEEICEKHAEIDKYKVYLKEIHPWGFRIKYRFWVTHYRRYHAVVGEVNQQILHRFGEEKIRLARFLTGHDSEPDM